MCLPFIDKHSILGRMTLQRLESEGDHDIDPSTRDHVTDLIIADQTRADGKEPEAAGNPTW